MEAGETDQHVSFVDKFIIQIRLADEIKVIRGRNNFKRSLQSLLLTCIVNNREMTEGP